MTKKKRCYKAPKKLVKGCSEVTFRDNIRHLICRGKKKPGQAKAIALSVLRTGCKVPKTKARSVKGIVAAGKRKKARAKKGSTR